MFLIYFVNYLFWCDIELLCFEYDWCVVGVVGVDEVDFVVVYLLVMDLDISLDVFQYVVEVDGVVGVWQGVCYQNFFCDLSYSEYYIFCCKKGF